MWEDLAISSFPSQVGKLQTLAPPRPSPVASR